MILENAHRFASKNVGRDENGNYEKGYFEWYVNFYSAILSYESEHRHEGTLEERAKNYADKRIKTISQERYSVIGSSTYQDLQSWYKDIVNETFNSNMKTSYKGYNVGDKVHIDEMNDPYADYDGREGTIELIDDLGQLHGTWGGCALIVGVDSFYKI